MRFPHRSREILILIAATVLVATGALSDPAPAPDAGRAMDSLMTAEWLNEHLDDPDLVVLDCSVHMEMAEGGGFKQSSGLADYEQGHIPTAGFADLLGDLRDADSPPGFALPTAEESCAAMGRLGVGDDSRVVLYDTSRP